MIRANTLIPKIDWIGPFIGIAAVATLIAAPAFADDDVYGTPNNPPAEDDTTIVAPAIPVTPPSNAIFIDQFQFGDVFANMDVHIGDFAKSASVTSTAVANTASGFVDQGVLDLDVIQEQDGMVAASGTLNGGSTRLAAITTTAYGNSATGGSLSGNTAYNSDQTVDGTIQADTIVDLERTRKLTAATTGIANVSISENENGNMLATQNQLTDGAVQTTMDVDLDRVTHSAAIANTAGGNSVSTNGSTTTSISTVGQVTNSSTTIEASTDIYARRGHNVLGTTTAFGNSVTVQNEWGYASLGEDGKNLQQTNQAGIVAQNYLTLDDWTGTATSNAYGVGNTATISNVGSDTGLYADQVNNGAVQTWAVLLGTSDTGEAIVSATSIGNAATATLCATCGDAALLGLTSQVNTGSILANSVASIGHAGSITGIATAVGNAATYQSNGD